MRKAKATHSENSTEPSGQGKDPGTGRVLEIRVQLHPLCSFGKSQTPCRQISAPMIANQPDPGSNPDPDTSCVTLSRSFNFSELHSPYQQNGGFLIAWL